MDFLFCEESLKHRITSKNKICPILERGLAPALENLCHNLVTQSYKTLFIVARSTMALHNITKRLFHYMTFLNLNYPLLLFFPHEQKVFMAGI